MKRNISVIGYNYIKFCSPANSKSTGRCIGNCLGQTNLCRFIDGRYRNGRICRIIVSRDIHTNDIDRTTVIHISLGYCVLCIYSNACTYTKACDGCRCTVMCIACAICDNCAIQFFCYGNSLQGYITYVCNCNFEVCGFSGCKFLSCFFCNQILHCRYGLNLVNGGNIQTVIIRYVTVIRILCSCIYRIGKGALIHVILRHHISCIHNHFFARCQIFCQNCCTVSHFISAACFNCCTCKRFCYRYTMQGYISAVLNCDFKERFITNCKFRIFQCRGKSLCHCDRRNLSFRSKGYICRLRTNALFFRISRCYAYRVGISAIVHICLSYFVFNLNRCTLSNRQTADYCIAIHDTVVSGYKCSTCKRFCSCHILQRDISFILNRDIEGYRIANLISVCLANDSFCD